MVGPPLWKIGKSIGMISNPIDGKMQKMATKPPTSIYIYIPQIIKHLIWLVTEISTLSIFFTLIYIYILCIYCIYIYKFTTSVKMSHVQTPEAATLLPSSSPSWHSLSAKRVRFRMENRGFSRSSTFVCLPQGKFCIFLWLVQKWGYE